MAVELLPVHVTLWVGFLLLWSSHRGTSEVCLDDYPNELKAHNSAPGGEVEKDAIDRTHFFCVLDPTNRLNCSWSFDKLREDAELSVGISICDAEELMDLISSPRVSHGGSQLLILDEYKDIKVIVKFNVTLDDLWTVYSYHFDEHSLEVPSPPHNLTAVLDGSNLLVSWALPHSRTDPEDDCFVYQLDLGDQGKPREVDTALSHTEQNVGPGQSYSVRVRTKISQGCQDHGQWSEWSHTVVVEQPVFRLSILMIVSISLGIPMILLAILLLVRHQRLMKVLFPPIPRPPPKYIHFLEKNDPLGPVHAAPPVQPAEEEEEITQVEDAHSGKTL